MRFLFFLLIIYLPLKAISQHQEPNIFIGKDAPIWMQEFSKKDRNVQSITKAYSNYYKKNPFVKSTYTQFYKRWMHWVRPFAQSDGRVVIPDINQQLRLENDIINARNSSANRAGNWTFNGPKSTYSTDGATKVTWQTNIYSIDIFQNNPNYVVAGGESGGAWLS